MINENLFNELKEWRLEKSRELKLPAFCIFNNSTLIDISETSIESKSDLLQIKGIGSAKIEAYGDDLIKIIQDYNENDDAKAEVIESKTEENKVILTEKPKKKIVKDITKNRVVPIHIEKDTEQRIKSYLKGKASEMVIKYTLINSGYSVLRGERWLNYHIMKKP